VERQVELATEAMIDAVLDDLNELVPDIAKLRTVSAAAAIDPAVLFGLDAALWRTSLTAPPEEGGAVGGGAGGGAGGGVGGGDVSHMAAEAECYHVLPPDVPSGWCATRASLEAALRVASPDELYRIKGVVPFSFDEATAEAARQGLPAPDADARASKLGDTFWLFNGVAGRLTLEPLPKCAGPASLVMMGQGLHLVVADLETALSLPRGAMKDAGTLTKPNPTVKVQFNAPIGFAPRMISNGVARGLCAPEPPPAKP
jgi:hypothetical protein